jgi:hypothetical protein
MKNKYFYAPLAVIIVVSLFFLSPRQNIAVSVALDDPLTHAIHTTGAKVQELSVNGWSKLPLPDLADEQMASIARRAMEKIGVGPDQYQISHQRSANHRQVKAEVRGDRFHAVVTVQVLYPSWEKKGHEVYLVLNIDQADPQESAAAVQEKIVNIINDSGGSARVSTCLVGWLDGKLEEDEKLAKLNNAFHAVNATVIDKLSYPNLASYSGFTPLVKDWLTVGQDRININMAIRYSHYDNRTYVMVGSPVITREY